MFFEKLFLLQECLCEPRHRNDDIWFSRDIQQGVVRRWMIVVQSVRIMLIRQADGSYTLETDAIYAWTPQWELQDLARQGRAVLDQNDRHVLVRIGYTCLRRRKVSDCFDEIRPRFPATFSWTQCQDFLRQFVNSILDRPDNEWQWFSDNTDKSRQNLSQLPQAPGYLMAAFQAQQQQQNQGQSQHSAIQANRLNWQAGTAMQMQQQNNQTNQQLSMQSSQNYPGCGYGA